MDTRQAILQIADALSASPSKLRRARVWLVKRLMRGDVLASAIYNEAELCGYSKSTLRKAAVGLVKRRKAAVWGGRWLWSLHPRFDTEGVNEYREDIVDALLDAVR